MYRVKNEERWIEQSIKSIYDFCDEIVVFDDNSIDNTKKICTQFDKVVDIHTKTDSTTSKGYMARMHPTAYAS